MRQVQEWAAARPGGNAAVRMKANTCIKGRKILPKLPICLFIPDNFLAVISVLLTRIVVLYLKKKVLII